MSANSSTPCVSVPPSPMSLISQSQIGLGKHVLELGCGHGLPGLVVLSKGALVDFIDYNAEVVQQLTIPNVWALAASAVPESVPAVPAGTEPAGTELAGAEVGSSDAQPAKSLQFSQERLELEADSRQQMMRRARFFSGDWSGLLREDSPARATYDIILTSDTLYNQVRMHVARPAMQLTLTAQLADPLTVCVYRMPRRRHASMISRKSFLRCYRKLHAKQPELSFNPQRSTGCTCIALSPVPSPSLCMMQ